MAQQVSSPGRSHEPREQELAAGHPQVTEAVLGAQFLRDAHLRAPVPQSRAPPWAASPQRSPLHRSSKARVSEKPCAPAAGSSAAPAASSPGSARRGLPSKSSADSALPRLAASSHGPRPQPAPEATPPHRFPAATPPNPPRGRGVFAAPPQPLLRQPSPPGPTPTAHLPLSSPLPAGFIVFPATTLQLCTLCPPPPPPPTARPRPWPQRTPST